MQYLADWAESKSASIVVNNTHFMVDSTCKLEIDSFGDSQCGVSAASATGQDSITIVAVVGPIASVLFIAGIAVVIIVLCVWKCHFQAKYRVR